MTGPHTQLTIAQLERKRCQEGFTEEVAKVRAERKRRGR